MKPDKKFETFPKIPRLNREVVITEKIDGTNASVLFEDDGTLAGVGSRKRWITPDDDNFGFARWAHENAAEIFAVTGPGHHFGEWWGSGIQRRYDLNHKRFSLFAVHRYMVPDPDLAEASVYRQYHDLKLHDDIDLYVVPVLAFGPMAESIATADKELRAFGSAATRFGDPEGLIVWHTTARQYFKVTLEGDEKPKGA